MSGRRWSRILLLIAAGAVVSTAIAVGPMWASGRYRARASGQTRQAVALGVAQAIRIAYAAAVVAAPALLAVGMAGSIRARRRGQRAPIGAMRGVASGGSLVLCLLLMEGLAALHLARAWRIPDLPTQFPKKSRAEINIVVIGESSALGVPYDPWYSVGQVVGWQLRRVFPHRTINVESLAQHGISLEQAAVGLTTMRRRPDAFIVYSGHNEFQARFGWSRDVRHYAEEGPVRLRSALTEGLMAVSPMWKYLTQAVERQRVPIGPPARVTRELIDHPACTPEHRAHLLENYSRHLDNILDYADQFSALTMVIIPPGNDADVPPSRSYLDPDTPLADRERFAREFRSAVASMDSDPTRSAARLSDLIARQPTFAEAHYRLGQLLGRSGKVDQARREFVLARDLDGMPMRCPSDFQEAARRRTRGRGVVIDAPSILERLGPSGLLDDYLFHDAQHMNFRGYLAIAQDVLDQLKARRAFGWPGRVPSPRIDPGECARTFQLDAARWAEVCRRSANYYIRTAYIRHDPSEALARATRWTEATERIERGAGPESVGMPGLGVWPEGIGMSIAR